MASELETRKALDSHLASMPGAPPIDWENVGFEQSPALYLSQYYLAAEGGTVGRDVGGTDVLTGVYQITVNAPKGAGRAAYAAEVERIRSHFVRSSSVVEGATRVTFEKVWTNRAAQDETHFRVPVSIRFRAL